MTNSRRRLTAFRGDDQGSAVAFLPILGLLLIAGVAALIGISLQASDSDSSDDTPPLITAGALGRPCTDEVGPAPTGAQARLTWLGDLGACINGRIESALGEKSTSTSSGYAGVVVTQTFDGTPQVVVRWTSSPPPVITGWVALHGEYAQEASPTIRTDS